MLLPPSDETVILVDGKNRPCGHREKHAAHQTDPARHRAFSVFIFNKKGEMLIQRRALGKYHSPGLWANSCCGHPRPGEEPVKAAKRRLEEELGFTTDLAEKTQVSYFLKLTPNLWEIEFTHVFHGIFDGDFIPNPEEVCEIMWIKPEEIKQMVKNNPEQFARWFRLYVLKYYDSTVKSQRNHTHAF